MADGTVRKVGIRTGGTFRVGPQFTDPKNTNLKCYIALFLVIGCLGRSSTELHQNNTCLPAKLKLKDVFKTPHNGGVSFKNILKGFFPKPIAIF